MESDFPPYYIVKGLTEMTAEDYQHLKATYINKKVLPRYRTLDDIAAAGYKSWKQYLLRSILREW